MKERANMGKPGLKFLVVFSTIVNIPMSIAMSLCGLIFSGHASELLSPALPMSILVSFVLACIVMAIIPLPRLAMGFPRVFGLDPESLIGRLVGNIPTNLIFVVLVGLCMDFLNVQVLGGAPFPAFIFAFLHTFIPMFVVCYIITFFIIPIARRIAFSQDKKE